MKRKIVLTLCLVTFGLFLPKSFIVSTAQEGSIRQQESTQDLQTQVKAEYQDDLEKYRQLERSYVIAVQEMNQLGTLASQEKAFQATKSVLSQRNEVLTKFLELLKLRLIDTHGVAIEVKSQTIEQIQIYSEALEEYQQSITAANNQQQLDQVATNFLNFKEPVENVYYKVVALNALGKLQVTYDKTEILIDDYKEVVLDTPSNLRKAEKERSFSEIQTLVDESKQELYQASQLIISSGSESRDSVVGEELLGQVNTHLSLVYGDLSQVLTYLEEIRQ